MILETHNEQVHNIVDNTDETRSLICLHAYILDLKNNQIGNAFKEEYIHPKDSFVLENIPLNYRSHHVKYMGKSKLTNNIAISTCDTLFHNGKLCLLYIEVSGSGVYIHKNHEVSNAFSHINFEASDTILNCNTCDNEMNGNGLYFFLNKKATHQNEYEVTATISHSEKTFISDDGKFIYVCGGGANRNDIGLAKLNIDYNNYTVTYNILKKELIYEWRQANDPFFNQHSSLTYTPNEIVFSANNRFLFVSIWDLDWRFYELEIDIQEDDVKIVKGEKLSDNMGGSGRFYNINSNSNHSKYYFTTSNKTTLRQRTIKTDNTILAIDYKGQRFFSPRANNDVDVDINNMV